MEILRAIVAGAALAAFVGCWHEREPTPFEFMDEEVSVHSLLLAGTDTATVLLTRVRSSQFAWDQPSSRPLEGATVRLIAATDTLHLVQQSGMDDRCTTTYPFQAPPLGDLRAGCYLAAVPGGVRAGGRYELVVELPGGGTIRGSATVPEVPVILTPEGGAVFKVRPDPRTKEREVPVEVRWAQVERDQQVELAVAPVQQDCTAQLAQSLDMGGWLWLTLRGVEAVHIVAAHVQCRGAQAPPNLDAHLHVTAFDTVYSRYVRELPRGGSASRTKAAAGVSGAIGVFAGAATATVPITLVQ